MLEHAIAGIKAGDIIEAHLVEILTNEACSAPKVNDLSFLVSCIFTDHLSHFLWIWVTSSQVDSFIIYGHLVVVLLELVLIEFGKLIHYFDVGFGDGAVLEVDFGVCVVLHLDFCSRTDVKINF